MGACSISGLAAEASAQEQAGSTGALKELSGKLEAARVRFARLMGILNSTLAPEVRKQVLNALGRECARSYGSLIGKYRGNLQGFLEEGRRQWMESASYDEQSGTIRVVDKSRQCSCPLVQPGQTPGEFCDCTLGWQEEAYSTILGHPVKARLEQSILRGGRSCVFVIEKI
jgi:hypothetical protein